MVTNFTHRLHTIMWRWHASRTRSCDGDTLHALVKPQSQKTTYTQGFSAKQSVWERRSNPTPACMEHDHWCQNCTGWGTACATKNYQTERTKKFETSGWRGGSIRKGAKETKFPNNYFSWSVHAPYARTVHCKLGLSTGSLARSVPILGHLMQRECEGRFTSGSKCWSLHKFQLNELFKIEDLMKPQNRRRNFHVRPLSIEHGPEELMCRVGNLSEIHCPQTITTADSETPVTGSTTLRHKKNTRQNETSQSDIASEDRNTALEKCRPTIHTAQCASRSFFYDKKDFHAVVKTQSSAS